MASPVQLLTSRRLGPLCVTQACGAFNDNLVKNAMIVLAMFRLGGNGPGLAVLAGALFIAPYALLSATAGQLADRFDKAWLIRWTKVAELVLMVVSAIGFLTASIPLLLLTLFWLGVQATMFGPLKYGILPDHLAEDELVAGNGLIEASTFLTILAGTVAGGGLGAVDNGPAIVSATGLLVSLLGLVAALRVPSAPSKDPALRVAWNPLLVNGQILRMATRNRPVWMSILGLSWFWTIGATLLAEFPTIAKETLAAEPQVVTLLLTMFALGIGCGSMVCARLLRNEVSARFVPIAGLGITIFTWDFATAVAGGSGLATVGAILTSPHGWRVLADLLLLSLCGGLYSVPLYAIMQEQAPPSHRSRMIGANNIMNALMMIAGAGAVAALAASGFTPPVTLKLAAALNALIASWLAYVLLRSGRRSFSAEDPHPPAARQ